MYVYVLCCVGWFAEWFEMAAEQKNPDAQFSLGIHYMFGRGVTKDLAKATALYQAAADQKHPVALCNIGLRQSLAAHRLAALMSDGCLSVSVRCIMQARSTRADSTALQWIRSKPCTAFERVQRWATPTRSSIWACTRVWGWACPNQIRKRSNGGTSTVPSSACILLPHLFLFFVV